MGTLDILSTRFNSQEDEIMKALLVHEKKSNRPRFSGLAADASDSGGSSDSDSDDDRAAANAIMDTTQTYRKFYASCHNIL